MKQLKIYLPLLSVFALALLIRLLYNFTAGKGYVAQFDAAQYERLGIHLLTEHCFCDTPHVASIGRPPLWPAIIAAIYGIFGINNLNVRLFLSLLGSGTCVLIYLLARDIFGKRAGMVAGIIAAFYPGLFIYDGWLYSESLYTFLFTFFIYALYRYQQSTQTRWMLISGIALGLSTLARQNGIFIFGMLIVFAIIIGWKHIMPWKKAILSTAGIILITGVIVMPWSIRNYLVSGYIVPVATGSSTILAGSYNNTVFTNPLLGAPGMWVPPDAATPPIENHQKCCTIWGEDPNQEDYAKNWILTHLSSMPRLLALHFINIWRPITPDGALPISQFPNRHSSQLIKISLRIIPPIIIFLAVLGTILTWKSKRQELLLIYLAIGLTILQCVALYGSVRFRAPIEPELVLLAAGVLYWLDRRLYKKDRQHVPVSKQFTGSIEVEQKEASTTPE